MKKLKKLMSLFLAMAMVFGMLSSAMHSFADEHRTNVIIHKIVMNNDDFTKHDMNKKYDGGKIGEITDFFGKSAKEVAGVHFEIYKEVDTNGGNDLPGNDTKFGGLGESNKYYSLITSEETKNDGLKVENLENGTYIIVENKEKSSYVGKDGKTLSNMKAVPTKITLPMTLPDGSGYFDNDQKPLHIYPKNTEADKPDVSKSLDDAKNQGDNSIGNNNSVSVGQEVNYKIETTVKAGSEYKKLQWFDTLTKGLKLLPGEQNADITITADNNVQFTNADYNIEATDKTLKVTLTPDGLNKVAKVTGPQQGNKNLAITIKYKAEVTSDAVVKDPLTNTVSLHYGNSPENDIEPSNPPQLEPKEKKIKVVKKFNGNDQWPDALAEVKVQLQKYDPVSNTFKNEGNEVSLTKNKKEHEWTNLDDNATYRVVESTLNGYSPLYKNAEGTNVVEIDNRLSNNPPPITPDPVIVRTFGKKFVKTNDKEESTGLKRLAGAEFIVSDKDKGGRFLALKNAAQKQQQKTDYEEAEKAYQNAIEAYNKLSEEERQQPNGIKAKGLVDTTKATRDKKLKELKIEWIWVNDKTQAHKFISDFDGKFEVTGLKKGTYYLIETKAPAGYALLPNSIKFDVDKDSYDQGDIKYDEKTSIQKDASQVKNGEVNIPQTGGIGTVIFAVVGITLMAGAVIAMKRRGERA